MIWTLLLFVGFLALWKGADWLVEGSSELAHKFKIPEFIIGVTVVAFGTSLPELCVNIIATINGELDIVFGNVIGSNMANSLLILGLSAIIAPIIVHHQIYKKEIRLNVGITVLLLVLLFSSPLLVVTPILSRFKGAILLSIFGLFLYTLLQKNTEHSEVVQSKGTPQWVMIAQTFGGFAALLLGGSLTIESAQQLAGLLGLSQAFISLFIIAIGTSLPELVTCVVACLKKRSSLVIGNILGSNIFNIILILGTCFVIKELPFPDTLLYDLLALCFVSLLLLVLLWLPKQFHYSRWKGVLLFSGYLIYCVYLFYFKLSI